MPARLPGRAMRIDVINLATFLETCYSAREVNKRMSNPVTMPRAKDPSKDGQVTIALSGAWLDEAEAIAEARSEPGLSITRADVLRMAIRRGLDVLAAETKRRK